MADVTLTANGTNNIYALNGGSSNYTTARTTYSYTYSSTTFYVGQQYLLGNYSVNRGTPLFDMSAISQTIASATFKCTGAADSSFAEFNMQIRAYTESSLASDTTSYMAYGGTSFGSINSSDYSSSADGMSIEFNASGITYLNSKAGGNCYLMLISDEDVAESAPTTRELISFVSGEYSTTAKRPHLELTYATSSWTPKIIWFMKGLFDDRLDYIRRPLQKDIFIGV